MKQNSIVHSFFVWVKLSYQSLKKKGASSRHYYVVGTLCCWEYEVKMNTKISHFRTDVWTSFSAGRYVLWKCFLAAPLTPTTKEFSHSQSHRHSVPLHTGSEFHTQASDNPIKQMHWICFNWLHSGFIHILSLSAPYMRWCIASRWN